MKTQLSAFRRQLSGEIRRISIFLTAESSQLKAVRRRGFTLIELLVVVAIIVFISAVILANTNKFGGESQVQNLAYDIALSVREAQVYGISVQRSSSGASGFGAGYGMYFDKKNHNTTYNLFADTLNNGTYAAGQDVAPSPYKIGRGFYIKDLCVTPVVGGETCNQDTLTFIFLRPEPDAWINSSCSKNSTDGTETCTQVNREARIVVDSPRGDCMNVIVDSNGQIGVKANPNCS